MSESQTPETVYVIVQTASYDGRNLVQSRSDQKVYLRRWEADTRRGMHGCTRVRIATLVEDAKTWKTREAAEKVAARFSNSYRTFVVEAVTR